MKTTITQATLGDILALNALLNELFSQEEEFNPNDKQQQRGLEEIICNENVGTIFVAKIEDKVVGMVSLLYTISTALGGKVALLEDMVVASSYQNQGIGKALLNHAIAFAQNQNIKRITLLTDKTNINAQRFYQAFGFAKSSMIAMRRIDI
ncbi:MAG: GNAT family N-acetyltransferase [Campylobacterales bacterium]|nr:GNAT family N-acetyltransferase [Campylobacterales bacterium]